MFDSSVNPHEYRKYLAFLMAEASLVYKKLGYEMPYIVMSTVEENNLIRTYTIGNEHEMSVRCQLLLSMLKVSSFKGPASTDSVDVGDSDS